MDATVLSVMRVLELVSVYGTVCMGEYSLEKATIDRSIVFWGVDVGQACQ